jgi:hypothetical protein
MCTMHIEYNLHLKVAIQISYTESIYCVCRKRYLYVKYTSSIMALHTSSKDCNCGVRMNSTYVLVFV